MKFCVKCGAQMNDDMSFCPKCGNPSIGITDAGEVSAKEKDYAEYWGLSYSDTYKKTIELTPNGVHIYRTKGVFPKFDNTIPYNQIIDLHSKRASGMSAGYLSVITATAGLQIEYTVPNGNQSTLLANDENTVIFQKSSEAEVERIFRALGDICEAPPTNVYQTQFNSTSQRSASTKSSSLANPPKAKKKTGCLIPVAVFLVVLAIIVGVSVSNSSKSSPTSSNTDSTSTDSTNTAATALTKTQKVFMEAFECGEQNAIKLSDAFDKVGLSLSSADKVSRREDLDNWNNDGSIAYEVADVIRVDSEWQRAFVYLSKDGELIDLSFYTCNLYEAGEFKQTAKEAVQIGWAASMFEDACPISINLSMGSDSIGTPVVKGTITNNTDKAISAIKIMAMPIDVYGNTIKSYGFGDEYINLTTDDVINAWSSKTTSWALYGYDSAKSVSCWIYSVYFSDGSQWGNYTGLSMEVIQTYGVFTESK